MDGDGRDGRYPLILNHGRVVKYVSYHLEVFAEVLFGSNPDGTLNLNVHYSDQEMIAVEQ